MSKRDREICDAAVVSDDVPEGSLWVLLEHVDLFLHKDDLHKEDAEFIAYFNPSKVREMLDEIASLKEQLQLEYSMRTRLQNDWQKQRAHMERQIETLRAERDKSDA